MWPQISKILQTAIPLHYLQLFHLLHLQSQWHPHSPHPPHPPHPLSLHPIPHRSLENFHVRIKLHKPTNKFQYDLLIQFAKIFSPHLYARYNTVESTSLMEAGINLKQPLSTGINLKQPL